MCGVLLQRSFRKELFEEAAVRLGKSCIKTSTEIERFKALADNAYQIAGNFTMVVFGICHVVVDSLRFSCNFYNSSKPKMRGLCLCLT